MKKTEAIKTRIISVEKVFSILPVLINIFFLFVVFSVLFSRVSTYTSQIDWDLDFMILIIANLIFVIMELFSFPSRYQLLFFFLRIIAIAIMAIPYPHTMFIDSFLVTGLSLSLNSKLKIKYSVLISLVILALYSSIKFISGIALSGVSLHITDLVFFICLYGSFNLLYYLSRFSSLKYIQNEKDILVLKGTISQLTAESSHILNYAAHAEESSSIEERKRITRELHDIIGKTFTDVIMMMEANVRNTPDDKDELKQIFQWVGDQSRSGLAQVREILYDLRSSIKEEPVELKSLLGLCESFSNSTGIKISLVWANAKISYGLQIDSVVYRIVQEALINTLRHSDADRVEVSFWDGGNELLLSIQDNGNELNKENEKGIGQSGMEERLVDLDGSIVFIKNLEGYLVRVSIPLHRKEIISNGR